MKNGEDEFTLVTRKPRSNQKFRTISASETGGEKSDPLICEVSEETLKRQVEASKEEIKKSAFFSAALVSLTKCLQGSPKTEVSKVLCYGLGCFSSCLVARHQLGFLLALVDALGVQSNRVQIFDPLFRPVERTLLSGHFALSVIDFNEEGKRRVDPEACTLLFAPHCPKQLTNNFLWANWKPELLSSCLVLGNTISSIVHNPASLPETTEYLVNVAPHTLETSLQNSFRLEHVFNDLSFHAFDLSKAPASLWYSLPAPIYPENDTGKVIKNGQQP